jgi:hypothetical protein
MFKRIENLSNADFKKQWTDEKIKEVMKTLTRKFKKHYHIYNAEDHFGFPYTSSSEFAMVSNTNCLFDIEKGFNFDCIGISNKGKLIAIASDYSGNERYYEITK